MVRRARISCSSPIRTSGSRRMHMSGADHMGNRCPRTLTDFLLYHLGVITHGIRNPAHIGPYHHDLLRPCQRLMEES